MCKFPSIHNRLIEDEDKPSADRSAPNFLYKFIGYHSVENGKNDSFH